MLGKILKHDMKTMSRFAVPMFITSGIIAVVCCAILFFSLLGLEQSNPATDAGVVGMIIGAISTVGFYMLGIVAIVVISVVITVMTVVRYYKSLFTDEGYLNMVLPVNTSSMFNAKILSTLIWSAISQGCTYLCVIVALVVPIVLYDPTALKAVMDAFASFIDLFTANEAELAAVTVIETVNSALYLVESVFIIITAITLGCVIFKKAKVLASIGLYFVIIFAQEVLNAVFRLTTTLMFTDASVFSVTSSVFNLVLTVCVTALMYYVNYYVLNKKFNIE